MLVEQLACQRWKVWLEAEEEEEEEEEEERSAQSHVTMACRVATLAYVCGVPPRGRTGPLARASFAEAHFFDEAEAPRGEDVRDLPKDGRR